MSRFGMFVCLLVLVAVAACVDMPPNVKPADAPKDGPKLDAARQNPPIPPSRPEGSAPRTDAKLDLPKGETPKPDAKPKDGKS